MKFSPAFLLLAACAPLTSAPNDGLPYSLMREDAGTLSGVWREGRSNGLVLTIDLSIGTFAASRGCSNSGGVLRRIEGERYALEHYTSGFSVEGCGPWRASPELAPLDGREVLIRRSGNRLLVSGRGRSLNLSRQRLRG
jgi:hypothetical protein